MSLRDALLKVSEKPLNESEEKLVAKIKEHITSYVKENGMRGVYRDAIELDDKETSDIRSDVVVNYMQREGLSTFGGGLTTNTINVVLTNLYDPTQRMNNQIVIKFRYVVRF